MTFSSCIPSKESLTKSVAHVNIFSVGFFSHRRGELFNLPRELIEMVAAHLDDNVTLQLARTSRAAYLCLYPIIKAAMVKALKILVQQDDTMNVSLLLQTNPNLLLKADHWDPDGLAYVEVETTPYQDALADPFAEEMRELIEESFPGASRAEQLFQAALQAKDFERVRFDGLRKKVGDVMELTNFAYVTHRRKYDTWKAAGSQEIDKQTVRDAWIRVAMVQELWPPRLRKLFGTSNKCFDDFPRDLPQPAFRILDQQQPWLANGVKGCDIRLETVPTTQVLSSKEYLASLKLRSFGLPYLIRESEESKTIYYLYGPCVQINEDRSEWRLVVIDDPDITDLINTFEQRPAFYPFRRLAFNFSHDTFIYDPGFSRLYDFAAKKGLYFGSGGRELYAATMHYYSGIYRCSFPLKDGRNNNAWIQSLYENRSHNLAQHLVDLRLYLQCSQIEELQHQSKQLGNQQQL